VRAAVGADYPELLRAFMKKYGAWLMSVGSRAA